MPADDVATVMKPLLEALLERRLSLKDGPYVFHRNGEFVGDLKRCWNTANKKAGMSKLFHDLRRTAVRNFIEQGIPERLGMKFTGHRTNHMLHRYHIVTERDLRDVLSKNNPTTRRPATESLVIP